MGGFFGGLFSNIAMKMHTSLAGKGYKLMFDIQDLRLVAIMTYPNYTLSLYIFRQDIQYVDFDKSTKR